MGMEQPCEAWFDNFWARREGNRIWIGKSYDHRASYSEATLVLWLTEEGGLTVDPKWAKVRSSETAHERAWLGMLRRLMLPVTLQSKLLEPPPFCLFSEEPGMLEYLYRIAKDELHSAHLDEAERDLLTQALTANFPEGRS